MKVFKDILFRMLFVLALLVGLGFEVYTNYNTPVCNTEISPNLTGEVNNVSFNDAFEDDHINQRYEIPYYVEQLVLLTVSGELYLLKEFPLSNWQPPKFS